MKNRKIDCLRCGVEMRYICREKMQLGQTGWILGDLPNLLAGALEVDFYACPQCKKIELFHTHSLSGVDATHQRKCPNCGSEHDFDYPKCPFCKYDYYSYR